MRWGSAIAAFALVACVKAQEIPTIRVPVRLVNLSTLVFSEDNRLIPDLHTDDFRLFDNGRAQTVRMDQESSPVSVAIAIQANRDVREYLPFMARAGSTVEALLVGESGEAAVVTYGDDITVAKPFEAGDLQSAFKSISLSGKRARMQDAGSRAIGMLAGRPRSRARILLLIGQPVDSGSESTLEALEDEAEKEDVVIHALSLPLIGKAFVSDTVSLQGAGNQKGGFQAGVDLGRLVSALDRSSRVERTSDPFSVLTAATGGTQLHFRKQRQMEDALAAIGRELRSGYLLSYYPTSRETGYHAVKVEVEIPGAKVYARPGYRYSTEPDPVPAPPPAGRNRE